MLIATSKDTLRIAHLAVVLDWFAISNPKILHVKHPESYQVTKPFIHLTTINHDHLDTQTRSAASADSAVPNGSHLFRSSQRFREGREAPCRAQDSSNGMSNSRWLGAGQGEECAVKGVLHCADRDSAVSFSAYHPTTWMSHFLPAQGILSLKLSWNTFVRSLRPSLSRSPLSARSLPTLNKVNIWRRLLHGSWGWNVISYSFEARCMRMVVGFLQKWHVHVRYRSS
jgi:hypothetical protein